jgi:hypothetical protein
MTIELLPTSMPSSECLGSKGFVSQEQDKESNTGFLLDLVCKRYPGRRPSDYLDLDEWTAFQFDSSLALKYFLEERKTKIGDLEIIMDGISNVCRGLGMKVKKMPKKRESIPIKPVDSDKIPKLKNLLAIFGGPGVKVENLINKK